MASKYLQKYPIPSGFQQILADFTREVLRDQPPNIIEYAAKYFEMLEKGEKFEFNSKFNVNKDDKKYQLSYNPKNAQEITKKASNIAARVKDADKTDAKQAPKQSNIPTKGEKSDSIHSNQLARQDEDEEFLPPAHHKNSKSDLPPQIIKQLDRIFDNIDANGNGYIQSNEIRKAIEELNSQVIGQKAANIDQRQVQQFIEVCDINSDGKICRKEFFIFMKRIIAPIIGQYSKAGTEKTVNEQQVQNYMFGQDYRIISEQVCNQIFDQIDRDQNGYITSSQISRAVEMFIEGINEKVQVDQGAIEEFIAAVDANKDGKISKEELYEFILSLLGEQ